LLIQQDSNSKSSHPAQITKRNKNILLNQPCINQVFTNDTSESLLTLLKEDESTSKKKHVNISKSHLISTQNRNDLLPLFKSPPENNDMIFHNLPRPNLPGLSSPGNHSISIPLQKTTDQSLFMPYSDPIQMKKENDSTINLLPSIHSPASSALAPGLGISTNVKVHASQSATIHASTNNSSKPTNLSTSNETLSPMEVLSASLKSTLDPLLNFKFDIDSVMKAF